MAVDRGRLKVRAFERRWIRTGQDLCDLIAPTKVDQGAGHTIEDETVASDVPCVYKQITRNAAQVTVEGVTVITTHEIEMEADENTRAIDQHYKIRVQPRDDNEELFFEHPVARQNQFMPLVVLQAVHVNGFSKPAMT